MAARVQTPGANWTWTLTARAIPAQARAAIADPVYGEALPELGPVPFDEVCEWFSIYDLLRLPGQSAAEATRQHFGDFKEKDMSDIARKLAALLEKHNLGLLLKNDER